MNNYFSHDSNARNSDKLIKVRMSLGAEGYGVYFMILERMREEKDYMSIKDYNMIAFDLRVDTSLVKKVVEDFGLFVFTNDGEYFYSESFLRRMDIKDETSRKKSEAGKKGAAKRWESQLNNDENDSNIAYAIENNSSAIAEPSKNIASKGKERKEKKSKVKESKEKDNKSTPKPQKHKYGEYKNVLLSDEELEKLQDEFPCDWQERIERVSEYCASTGKTYKNYLATMRNWARKDLDKKNTPTNSGNPFLEMMQDEMMKGVNTQ